MPDAPVGGTDRAPGFDVVVVGLGYVGLPLAQEACRSGLRVAGLDTSAPVVQGLAAGRSHVGDLSDADLAQMLAQGFTPTGDAGVLAAAATVVLCVPTPLSDSGGPDLSAVLAAADDVAAHLRPGTLVVLESTTYPGTTEDELLPVLERTGLRVGLDVFLAFSPERIDPGNARWGFRNTPKVVGGCTAACTQRARAFYEQIVDEVVLARGTREAEMAKLLENTSRHVNIALVNEMAQFCHVLDIDLWDVIRCAATKPFGFAAFTPGPGVGGHCIPIDPSYLSYTVRAHLGQPFRFVELAQEVNGAMPAYVVHRVQQLLNERSLAVRGSRVLLLGVTYKADVADQRESPAVHVAGALRDLGAQVLFHDPHVERWDALAGSPLTVVPDLHEAVASVDAVVLLQQHREYDVDDLAAGSKALLDTRGASSADSRAVRL